MGHIKRMEIRQLDDGTRYSYSVERELGAIEFWVVNPKNNLSPRAMYYGGVEKHSAIPSPYSNQTKPDHENCPTISGRSCYHNGSSLLAHDKYIPIWKQIKDKTEPELIWKYLEKEYDKEFNDENY
jgi:hypothetical protein